MGWWRGKWLSSIWQSCRISLRKGKTRTSNSFIQYLTIWADFLVRSLARLVSTHLHSFPYPPPLDPMWCARQSSKWNRRTFDKDMGKGIKRESGNGTRFSSLFTTHWSGNQRNEDWWLFQYIIDIRTHQILSSSLFGKMIKSVWEIHPPPHS